MDSPILAIIFQNISSTLNSFGREMIIFAYILFAFALFPFIFRTLFNSSGRYMRARLRESDQVDGFLANAEQAQLEARSVVEGNQAHDELVMSELHRRERGGC